MLLDYTSQFLAALEPLENTATPFNPSAAFLTFQTVSNELAALRSLIQEYSNQYIAAPLAMGVGVTDATWFSDADCTKFDANVVATCKHLNKIVSDSLAEVRKYSKNLCVDDALNDDLYSAVLRRREAEQSKQAVAFFGGVAQSLYARANGLLYEFSQLKELRKINRITIREPSLQQLPADVSNAATEDGASTDLAGEWDSFEQKYKAGVLEDGAMVDQVLEDLTIARQTEVAAQAIQQLGALFAEQVLEQSESINRLYAMATDASAVLDSANAYLSRAKRRLNAATKMTVVILLISIFSIAFLDYINT